MYGEAPCVCKEIEHFTPSSLLGDALSCLAMIQKEPRIEIILEINPELEPRFADLDAHTRALGEYLVNRPDLYEVTATKSKGWLSTGTEYSVSFAELVIE